MRRHAGDIAVIADTLKSNAERVQWTCVTYASESNLESAGRAAIVVTADVGDDAQDGVGVEC